MLIVLNKNTVQSLIIKFTPTKNRIRVGTYFGLFPKYKKVEVPCWTLEFCYTKPNDETRSWIFTCKSENCEYLDEICKNIVQQIKSFDANLINAAFEDAFLKEK